MVNWFQPFEIARTAIRVMLAGVIARYVDRREAQAALPRVDVHDDDPEISQGAELGLDATFAKRSEVWIDYVADAGDGWNATYTTAMFIGQESILVDGLSEPLRRSDLLVFGGDNVYPTPSPSEYRDRLKRPYEAAFPELPNEKAKRPWLFAIPGNHDWYDGLTSFLRVFCQGRAVGAWRTVQTRSYFAVKLPSDWMLWGSDIQLDTEIDAVQLEHFKKLARAHKKSRIILCTAKPAWIREMHRDEDSFKNYWYFLDQIRMAQSTIDVSIAGDLHHYIRYATAAGKKQKITAGGGGSFLRGTHDLPDSVAPPNPEEADFYSKFGEKELYRESGFAFPSRIESRRLALGALKFPLLRRSWAFCALLGGIYLMLAWSLGLLDPNPMTAVFHRAVSTAQELPAGLAGLIDYGARILSTSVTRPSAAVLPLVILLLFVTYAVLANHRARKVLTLIWGLVHGALHVSLAILIASLVAKLAVTRFGPNVLSWAPWEMLLVYLAIVAVGSLGGGILMGLYLVLSDLLLTLHTNEAFSAQALPDYRCFLRMKVEQNGALTIYPIGIRWAPRNWRRKLDRVDGEALFTPHGEMPRLHLIEGPITVQ